MRGRRRVARSRANARCGGRSLRRLSLLLLLSIGVRPYDLSRSKLAIGNNRDRRKHARGLSRALVGRDLRVFSVLNRLRRRKVRVEANDWLPKNQATVSWRFSRRCFLHLS